ncbi:MAG: hypothetical protein KDA93_01835 [Planctomycetaceae bacterium]|nr:hypothetical protein [Planctomycetaceae bacterium]
MAQIAVILIRVVFGLILGFAGLIVFGQGAIMIANADFPSWGLVLTMLAGLTIGSGIMFGAWRLLASTLRMPKQAAS